MPSNNVSSPQDHKTTSSTPTVRQLLVQTPGVREFAGAVLTSAAKAISGGNQEPKISPQPTHRKPIKGTHSEPAEGTGSIRTTRTPKSSRTGTSKTSKGDIRSSDRRHHNGGGDTRRNGQSGTSRSTTGNTQAARSPRSATETGQNGMGISSQTPRSGTNRHSDQGNHPYSSWMLPEEQRPVYCFDQGQTAQVFNCLPTMIFDSPGAAVAAVIFLAMHQPHRYQGEALNDRTRLLGRFRPNPASLAAASEAVLEMSTATSPVDRLSTDLTYYDQQFLLLASGMGANHAPRKIVNELLAIGDQIGKLNHPRREASARFMAAAILLVALRDYSRANEEMAKATALVGVAYPDAMMIELARSGNSELVEATLRQKGAQMAGGANAG